MNTKNYKTLLREIEEDLNSWGKSSLYIKKLNIVKLSVLTKMIYRSNTFKLEIPEVFL